MENNSTDQSTTPTQNPPSSKKKFFGLLLLAIAILGAFGFYYTTQKKAKTPKLADTPKTTEAKTFSCADTNNLNALKQSLTTLIRNNAESNVKASKDAYDTKQLNEWLNSTQVVSIKNVRTKTKDSEENLLVCESTVAVKASQEMWDNAKMAMDLPQICDSEGCESDSYIYSLDERVGNSDLRLKKGVLEGSFEYRVSQTDEGDITLDLSKYSSSAIDTVVEAISSAVRLDAIKEQAAKFEANQSEKQALSQHAIEIRVKELGETQTRLDSELNEVWQEIGETNRNARREEQKDWLEKRDVECQLEGSKSLYDLSDDEKEPYQIGYESWTDEMRQQDAKIRTMKCSNKRTAARIKELRGF